MALFYFLPTDNYWTQLAIFQPVFSSYLSSTGTTLLIIAVNVLVALAITEIRNSKKKPLLFVSLTLLVFLWLVPLIDFNTKDVKQPFTLSLVQANINQTWDWRVAHTKSHILPLYLELTRTAHLNNPDLIVWSEYAIPLDFSQHPEVQLQIQQLSNELGTPLLVGTIQQQYNPYEEYDLSILFTPQNKPQTYRALRPTPFEPEVQAGLKPGLFTVNEVTFGVLLCHEETQLDLARDLKQQGAQLIITQSNNHPFTSVHGFTLVSRFTQLIAAENKLPVARATNTGKTQVIESNGNVLSLPHNTQEILTHTFWI